MKRIEERIITAAIALVECEQLTQHAKHDYQEAQRKYFKAHGYPDGDIDPDSQEHAPFIAATAATYEVFQRSKRKGYNARKRLRTAVATYQREGGNA